MALPYQSAGLASSAATRLTAINREVLDARVYDQMFSAGTPALKTFMSKLEAKEGVQVEYAIRTGKISGAVRARDAQIADYATQTGEPATRAILNKYYYDWCLNLAQVDIDQNKGAAQLVSYVATQQDILTDSMKDEMGAWIWKPQTGSYMYSLHDAIGDTDDSAAYAGITTSSDLDEWCSFVMDCNPTTTTDTGVSPSLANFVKMERTMFDYNGKYPSAVYTTGAVWDCLADEMASNINLAGERDANSTVTWGVRALILPGGTPVLRDRNLTSRGQTSLSAFTDSTTRAGCLGHVAYFVDWDFIHPYYTPGHKFQLEEWTSLRSSGYNRIWNNISFEGGIITNRRRAHGLIANIDPTIADSAYTAGKVYFAGSQVS